MSTTRDEMMDLVLRIIRDMGHDTANIRGSSALSECGIDSLQAVDLIFRLEEEFGITIDMDDFQVRTVDEAVAFLQARVDSAKPAAAG